MLPSLLVVNGTCIVNGAAVVLIYRLVYDITYYVFGIIVTEMLVSCYRKAPQEQST